MKNKISSFFQKSWVFIIGTGTALLLPAFTFADIPSGIRANPGFGNEWGVLVLFGIPLVFTILIETIISVIFLLGLGKKEYIGKGLGLIVGINLITNPVLNFLFLVFSSMWGGLGLILIGILELLVIFVEWRLIRYAFGKEFRGAFFWSVIINVGSLAFGVLLLRVLLG